MKRREFVLAGAVSYSIVAAGCLESTDSEQQRGEWVVEAVVPEDIVAGFDEQQMINLHMLLSNGSGLPDETRPSQITIDTAALGRDGVNVENLSAQVIQTKSRPPEAEAATVESVEVTDGTVDLTVFFPDEAEYSVELELSGFYFDDVESTTDLRYDVHSADDHVETAGHSREFNLTNPQLHPPTLIPGDLKVDQAEQSQSLSVEWLTPVDDEVHIDVDMSALDEYRVLERVEIIEQEIRGADLEDVSITDSMLSVRLTPKLDTNYAAADISIDGIDITTTDPVESLSYEMTVDGVAHETVETEPFAIDDPPEPT